MIARTEEGDRELMLELAKGNDLALNELMRRWSGKIISYLERLCGNHATACDLAQETFVRVHKHRTRFRAEQKFSSWLYAIATNLARNHARWQQRRPVHLLDPCALRELATPCNGLAPDARVELSERAQMVRRAVHALPQDQQEVVILSAYEGLSHAEIAEVVKSKPKVVEMRLYRARKALAATLEAERPSSPLKHSESETDLWSRSLWRSAALID